MITKLKDLNNKEYNFNLITTVEIYLMIFVVGGLFGFVYEEIFYRIDLGYFTKRGTTLGPWIPIYGFGAILIIFLTEKLRKHPALLFIVASAATGLLELATGYVLYNYLGVRLWDYNVEIWNFGNIGGYICLRSVLFFGLSALFLQYIVHPYIKLLTSKMQVHWRKTIAIIPALLFIIDMSANLIRLVHYGP